MLTRTPAAGDPSAVTRRPRTWCDSVSTIATAAGSLWRGSKCQASAVPSARAKIQAMWHCPSPSPQRILQTVRVRRSALDRVRRCLLQKRNRGGLSNQRVPPELQPQGRRPAAAPGLERARLRLLLAPKQRSLMPSRQEAQWFAFASMMIAASIIPLTSGRRLELSLEHFTPLSINHHFQRAFLPDPAAFRASFATRSPEPPVQPRLLGRASARASLR